MAPAPPRPPAPRSRPDKEDIRLRPNPGGCRSCRKAEYASPRLPARHRPRPSRPLRNYLRRHEECLAAKRPWQRRIPPHSPETHGSCWCPNPLQSRLMLLGVLLLTQCNKASGTLPRCIVLGLFGSRVIEREAALGAGGQQKIISRI